jgi:hypothetical protein
MRSIGQSVRVFALTASALIAVTMMNGVVAAPPVKPACGTSGAIAVADPVPASHTYVQGNVGSVTPSLNVSSPPVNFTSSCDSSLDPVFGNGNGADPYVLPFTPSIKSISVLGVPVGAATDALIRGQISAFATAPFQLTPPGSGSQTISFTFTNSAAIPAAEYDIEIEVKPETGTGVGTTTKMFVLTVEEPVVVAQDTLPPDVSIQAPTNGQQLKLNQDLAVEFTAQDPLEGGAGTGVTAVRATIGACSGAFELDVSGYLTANPALPVAAAVAVTVTGTADTSLLGVGSFVLTAEADDDADHTGSATQPFTVGLNTGPLPPISVPNRQFKIGSTVPIKWTITDGNGAFLPPITDISIDIVSPTSGTEPRYAGDGATGIRWETDEFGNATQYITNYQIPEVGTFYVNIFVDDVCGVGAQQGTITFVASTKGGKV